MTLKNKQIVTNASQPKRKMVHCQTVVQRDAVRRESIDGVEHIIVSSATMPDDIVMNGGLYPADEIEKSFKSLELTLAPIEHPQINGQFISANDPRAIHEFHAGAFNMNVRRENGRVHIDKYINVSEAMKTDRGKRLLDRINELETNTDARPIHTSTGIFMAVEALDAPRTNAEGADYTWIAHDMVFDHDAILLDSVGAAQPHQGVGVAVNKEGEEMTVDSFDVGGGTTNTPDKFNRLQALAGNQEGMSMSKVHDAVEAAFEKSAIDADWIEELFSDKVIFWSDDQLFEVPYVLDTSGIATIVGVPLPVERNVTFTPKTNQKEGEAMKQMIVNALAAAGVDTTGMDDQALFDAYSQLQANQSSNEGAAAAGDDNGIAAVVANALKPLSDQIEGLQAKLNATDEAETNRLADLVANSGKYPALDADSAKLLGVDKLKEMAANCATAFGLSPLINHSTDGANAAPVDMPE